MCCTVSTLVSAGYVCSSVYLSVCLSVCLSDCLSVCLSVCQSVGQFSCLPMTYGYSKYNVIQFPNIVSSVCFTNQSFNSDGVSINIEMFNLF